MASQPANTTISVARRVRSYRNGLRHNNLKSLVNRMRPQIMSVPGEETQILRTFDASSDPQVTTSLAVAGNKQLPVVVFLRAEVTLQDAVDGITNLAFPVKIGGDRFLNKDSTSLTDDLHQDLRDV